MEQYQAASNMLRPTQKESTAAVPVRQSMPRPRGPNASPTPKKCKLAFSETNYLVYTIGHGLVKPQKAKLGAIQEAYK